MELSSADSPLVLLVEDNERSRSIRRQLFELEGCRVIGVSSADDALSALEATDQVDVVVTDINLSARLTDKSGLELARLIRARYPRLPIVAYTAFFGDEEITLEDRKLFDRWFPKGSMDSVGIATSVRDAKTLGQGHMTGGDGPEVVR